MNLVAKAGFAAAALTFAASFVMPAAAADLGGWGRGSIKDDHIQAPRTAASPCYFRADVGYSGSTAPGLRWTGDTDPDPASTYLNDVVRNTSMDATWTGGVGAGCGSGSRGFRYEFMLGYHGERALAGRTVPFDYAGD